MKEFDLGEIEELETLREETLLSVSIPKQYMEIPSKDEEVDNDE